MARHDAGYFILLEHDGAGAVSEEHTGGTVLPVKNPGIDFRTHDESATVPAPAHEVVCGRESVHESAAHGLHIERRAASYAEFCLQDAGRARKYHVRGGGSDNDQVDVLQPDPGRLDRLVACGEREVARVLAIRGNMALANTGARVDPFVGGLHHALE